MNRIQGMEPSTRRFLVRFFAAMASYCVLLPVALLVGRALTPPWRMLSALVVLPSIVLIVRAVMLLWREADELARGVMVESLAIGFAVGAPVVLVVGIFQVFGLAELSFMWAFAILMAGWLLGGYLARRRYT